MGDEQADLREELAPYVRFFEAFLAGDVDARDFEASYNALYLADETQWPADAFDVLDSVFATAEAFDPDPVPDYEGAASAAELTTQVESALTRLRNMLVTMNAKR